MGWIRLYVAQRRANVWRSKSQYLVGGVPKWDRRNKGHNQQYDEIILVLEGEVTAITETETLNASRLDTIWLPAGTRVTYQAEDALIFYAIQPADWAQPNSTEW